jgi:type VII secretion-associated serine protease mycosin
VTNSDHKTTLSGHHCLSDVAPQEDTLPRPGTRTGRRARIRSPKRIGAGAAAGVLVGVVLIAGVGTAAVVSAGPAPDGSGAGPSGSTRSAGSTGRAGMAQGLNRAGLSGAAPTSATAGSSTFADTWTSATAPIRRPMVAISRGPSTRTAPRLMTAGVRNGQSVRVSAVQISAAGARVTVVRLTGPVAATAAIAAAQADPAVVAVQVDQRVHALDDVTDPASAPVPSAPVSSAPVVSGSSVTGLPPSGSPGSMAAKAALSNDAERPYQWALDALRAEQAWDVTRGAGQIVAVVDSGVQGNHPDLIGQVLTGTDIITPATGNGWNDGRGHGTHVAGIIAALAGNGIGTAGLAPGVKILPVRALDAMGEGYDSDIASGVIWAADHGATVINLSVGGSQNSAAMSTAVTYAVARGAVVLAAAGNECQSGDAADYPAALNLPGELAVAATTTSGVSASYSNTGSYVQVAAPGDRIMSTYPTNLGDPYQTMSGTSMATPYAAAAVALIRAAAPLLTPVDAVRLLTSTADDVGTPGRDDETGAGLVDPVAALCSINQCPPGVTPSPTPSGTGSSTRALVGGAASVDRMTATVQAPLAPTVLGRAAQLAVRVKDGRCSVAGAAVMVTGSNRTAVGTTGADGVVRIAVAPVRTAGWTVTVRAPGHATASTSWAMTVVPAVTAKWTSGRVNVTVAPLLHQTVSVFESTAGHWVLRRKAVLGSGRSGTVTLAVVRTGRARVVVSPAGGLAAVTVEHG